MNLQQHWQNATAREKLMVIAMVLVVAGALLFALLVRPAWRTVQNAPAALNALEAKVQAMRTQAAQLRAAPSVAIPVVTPPSAERELSGPGATVSESRDAVGTPQAATTINLKNVDGARLAAWLARPEVQKQMKRLNLTRDAVSGRVSGSAVLRTSP